MEEFITEEDYQKDFGNKPNDVEKRKEALAQALDIRKFEIGLYWQRAAYFWAFIAAAFAGFFALQGGADAAYSYLIACLGFEFSLGWYLVNRGSKAWQQNWELHVDLLENEFMGPLYKTILRSQENYEPFDLSGPFKFSPSKINQILSLFVTLIWLCIMSRILGTVIKACSGELVTVLAITAIAIFFAVFLIVGGQRDKANASASVYRTVREVGKTKL